MTLASAPRAESRDLDDLARHDAPGSFVRLDHGYTHYQVAGPSSGRTVVLVHGFSVPFFVWEPTFSALTSAGFHVLRYDLFGRGFSDRPAADYGMPLYLEQLQDLLETLRIQQVDVIGLSMGGPIAAAFGVSHPSRVNRVVLIDPSGALPIPLGLLYRVAVTPPASDILFRVLGNERILKNIAEDFFDPEHARLFRERYRAQMEFRGFRRAIVSTVRNGMLGSFADEYERLGQLKKEVLLIWGEDDKTVPFDHSNRLRRLLPCAQFLPVKRCGHIPHIEQPDLVNPRIVEFLS